MTDKTPLFQAHTDDGTYIEKTAGRKTSFTQDVGNRICERLAAGETLVQICRDKFMPGVTTVYSWRQRIPSFAADYAHAREMQAETWGDEVIEIADDDTLDTVTKTSRSGAVYEAFNHENVQRSKLRVDTRFRIMGAVNARTFGAKTALDVSGKVDHEHTVTSLSDREKMRRLALFMLQDSQPGELIEGTAQPVAAEHSASPVSDKPATQPAESQ